MNRRVTMTVEACDVRGCIRTVLSGSMFSYNKCGHTFCYVHTPHCPAFEPTPPCPLCAKKKVRRVR